MVKVSRGKKKNHLTPFQFVQEKVTGRKLIGYNDPFSVWFIVSLCPKEAKVVIF